MIDLRHEMKAALLDREVLTALAEIITPAVLAALDRREADGMLSGPQAARLLGVSAGAFKALRKRHPALDELSTGTGKLRRWRRVDLERWLAASGRGRRYPGGAG